MAKIPITQDSLSRDFQVIRTMEMHTTGEPTRIIYSGFPQSNGITLLQKRGDAKANHDHYRRRVMLEPRGHREMFGALLVRETELTATGEADIGVLFMHCEGWPSMCGHATMGLGRFLVDFIPENPTDILLSRKLIIDDTTMTTLIKLHCPCGIVDITVPIARNLQGQLRSDPDRAVSFLSVQSFVTGIAIEIPLPSEHRWPELEERSKVTVDFCFGGAFYCVIEVRELGFRELDKSGLEAVSQATKALKAAITANPQFTHLYRHDDEIDLGFLYGIIVSDDQKGAPTSNSSGAETGLCFFGPHQIDRSPCGSGTAARRALAHAKGMAPESRWTYHSLISTAFLGQGAFTAYIASDLKAAFAIRNPVRVHVEGQAFYTGSAYFLTEQMDTIGSAGFLI